MILHQNEALERIPAMTNMEKRPFSGLSSVQAPLVIREAVCRKVIALEKRARTARLSFLVALAIASVSALVASFFYMWGALVSSGFMQYVALAFSSGAILLYSKELGLSMIESLPALGIALVLSAGLVTVGSIWSFLRLLRKDGPIAADMISGASFV